MSNAELSDLDLMKARFEALYTFNRRGRITSVNSPFDHRVPRFHFSRTREGNFWYHRADTPDPLASALDALCHSEPIEAPAEALPLHEADYRRLLEAEAPIETLWQGPALVIPKEAGNSGKSVLVTRKNAHVLAGNMENWLVDVGHSEPLLASLEEGNAVSICASVRISDLVHEAGLETIPAARKQGRAVQVVAAWADAVRSEKCLPLYSTSWDNLASQAVAAKLGARLYGTDFHIT